ncbi:MAG: hypothetical protein K2M43_01785 [Mycoplasmoidaceae bacterium]|nr:hypothetical protein [Mycoplasmoidaceae bacterium]
MTIVIVGVSLLLIVIQTFTDLGLVSYYYAHGMYEEDGINHLISAIMTVVTLIAFCAVMFIPTKIFMPRKGAKNVNKIN